MRWPEVTALLLVAQIGRHAAVAYSQDVAAAFEAVLTAPNVPGQLRRGRCPGPGLGANGPNGFMTLTLTLNFWK